MVFVLAMIIGFFCFLVFGGFIVQTAATMNGWGFASFVVFLLYVMWRNGGQQNPFRWLTSRRKNDSP